MFKNNKKGSEAGSSEQGKEWQEMKSVRSSENDQDW